MEITYDKSVDAVYIYFMKKALNFMKSEGIVTKTKGDWPIHLDFSKDGKLVGIEIMDASKIVDIDFLKKLKFIRIDEEK